MGKVERTSFFFYVVFYNNISPRVLEINIKRGNNNNNNNNNKKNNTFMIRKKKGRGGGMSER